MKKHPYRGQFPGVGPKTVEDLDLMGIQTREQLVQLGAEKAMARFMSLHGGWKPGMCSCQAYMFEGIIRDCLWYQIPDERKKELVAYTHALRAEMTE